MHNANVSDLSLSIEDNYSIDSLAVDWEQLESQVQPAFFLSWAWIGTWLNTIPANHRPALLRACKDDVCVGLALLGRKHIRRRGLVSSNASYLNESGYPEYDSLTIEHNGFLVSTQSNNLDLLTSLFRKLAETTEFRWDELFISAIPDPRQQQYQRALDTLPLNSKIRYAKPYYLVELERIRTEKKDYLSYLSRNSRSQLRRALKENNKQGEINIEVAADTSQALEMFADLRTLHQGYWLQKGQPGAFASEFSQCFHHKLITDYFPKGNIQLIKITAGKQLLGYLYNFIYKGTVCNYQSGINYEIADNKAKPGICCHYQAILYNLEKGYKLYDFLMGDQRYKSSLATKSDTMAWMVIQKPRPSFAIESFLQRIKSALRK